MWAPLLLAFLIALLFTSLLVWPLGWRRPGASDEASAAGSGIFLFAILFLLTWALGVWIPPWGPVVWDVSWATLLVIGLFVALLVLVLVPSPRRYASTGAYTGEGTTSPDASVAVEGFGVLFWIFVVLVLALGIFGVLD